MCASVYLSDPFMLLCVEVFCPFSLLNNIGLVSTYHSLSIHSTDRYLGCSHFVVMKTSVALSIFEHDFSCTYVHISTVYVPKNRIARSLYRYTYL